MARGCDAAVLQDSFTSSRPASIGDGCACEMYYRVGAISTGIELASDWIPNHIALASGGWSVTKAGLRVGADQARDFVSLASQSFQERRAYHSSRAGYQYLHTCGSGCLTRLASL